MGFPEFPRLSFCSPYTLEQPLMDLSNEARRYWEVSKAMKPIIHGIYIVQDLLDVIRAIGVENLGFNL